MSLAIRHLRNVFVAGKDLPRQEEVCAQMESSVRQGGVNELVRALDDMLDPADASVWIIRRLRVSFAIGEPKQSESIWAQGITQGIRRQIELGPDGHNALRFSDRATYWAWFLRDRATDSSSHWWFASFDGLKHLDYGTTCLTVLSRQPELTAPVLTLLEQWGVWKEVVQYFSEEQALQMLDWFSSAEDTGPVHLLEAAAKAWDWACAIGREPAKIRLSAVMRLRRMFADAPVAEIRGAVETVAVTETAFRSMPWEQWVRLVAAVWSRSTQTSEPSISVPPQVRLLLRQLPHEAVDELVRGWQARTEPRRLAAGSVESTEFGGWFLILSSYVSLDVDSLVEEAGRPALRWLFGRMCMGPRGRAAPADDVGLLWAAGLERAPDEDELFWPRAGNIEAWLTQCGSIEGADPAYFGDAPLERAWGPVAAALVRTFARRLPGFGKSSPAHLDTNIFAGRTSLVLSPGFAEVSISRRPLDILLRMGGFDGESCLLPWRDYATVTIRLT